MIGAMKDLLVWVLCGVLVFAGVVLGHGFAVSDAAFFGSVMSFAVGVINIVVGAVIAFFVSHFFYKKSGDDLKLTAEKLEAATNRILRYQHLKDIGVDVEVVTHEDGSVKGFRLKDIIEDSAKASSCALVINIGRSAESGESDSSDNPDAAARCEAESGLYDSTGAVSVGIIGGSSSKT